MGESAPAVATTLRQAAGLYKHCAEHILPNLKDGLPGERPNELLASMAHTLRCGKGGNGRDLIARHTLIMTHTHSSTPLFRGPYLDMIPT